MNEAKKRRRSWTPEFSGCSGVKSNSFTSEATQVKAGGVMDDNGLQLEANDTLAMVSTVQRQTTRGD
jgi:hypothetical protein